MPAALNRNREAGGYGWGHVFGRENRTKSKKWLDNFDEIKWKSRLGEPTGYNKYFRLGGCASVWYEHCFTKEEYGKKEGK